MTSSHRIALPLVLVVALGCAAPAEAAKRCKWREIPEPYVVDEPVHPTLTNLLEVLRRPERPEDPLGEHLRFMGDFHKVSPSTLRLVAQVRDTRFWVMGATVGLDRMHRRCRRRLAPAARRRERRWYRRQKARPLRLAVVHDDPDGGSGGGFFGAARDLLAGDMVTVTGVGAEDHGGPVAAVGLAPDGVASVALTFVGDDESEHLCELPVRDNAWALELPSGVTSGPDRITWRDAEGRALRSFDR